MFSDNQMAGFLQNLHIGVHDMKGLRPIRKMSIHKLFPSLVKALIAYGLIIVGYGLVIHVTHTGLETGLSTETSLSSPLIPS